MQVTVNRIDGACVTQLAKSGQQVCCLPPEQLSLASRSVTETQLCRVGCFGVSTFTIIWSTRASSWSLVTVQDATSMLSRMFSGCLPSRRDEKVRAGFVAVQAACRIVVSFSLRAVLLFTYAKLCRDGCSWTVILSTSGLSSII